jgi:tetratricopeptide (TPR) repeat protein
MTRLAYSITAAIFSALVFARPTSAQSAQWRQAMRRGRAAYQGCEFPKAQAYFRSAAMIVVKSDQNFTEAVETLDAAGRAFRAEGKFEKADLAFESALLLSQVWLGRRNPLTAASLEDLGTTFAIAQNRSRAAPLLKRALAIREKVFGPESPEVAQSLRSLGEAYSNPLRPQYARAESLFKKALAIQEKQMPAAGPAIAETLEDLGAAYAAQRDYAKAASLYRRSLAIYEADFGPDHCETALALENYATVLRRMNRKAEAEKLQARSLAILRKEIFQK